MSEHHPGSSDLTLERSHFTLERTFDASPERVFRAFATREGLAAWWSPGASVKTEIEAFDFREGGITKSIFAAPGRVFRNHLRYENIVPNRRIVAAMTMWHIDGATSSVLVISVDFVPEGEGCRLVFGEHGAFLDGLESSKGHNAGFNYMLDTLVAAVAADAVAA